MAMRTSIVGNKRHVSQSPATHAGAIGAIIAHEVTHGYDDQGRQFDVAGNMEDWWDEDSAASFEARAQVMVDCFNAYEFHGGHVNGKVRPQRLIASGRRACL